jgi:hypothetical protein
MHGGRTIGKHSEVFVAFDVAKKKHAMAIAEAGRNGEVRFLGDVENNPLPIERCNNCKHVLPLSSARYEASLIARGSLDSAAFGKS